jgi:uroporphyrinogen-III decarboxylase
LHIEAKSFLPVEIVFHPRWWNRTAGISFDRDFFFDPERRIEDEMKMKRVLWEHFGEFGYGEEDPAPEPVVGPVHLATAYMTSFLWGCEIRYYQDASPEFENLSLTVEEVVDMESPDPTENSNYRDFLELVRTFKERFGYAVGDFGWGNLQNLALDLMGQNLFLAYYDKPELVHKMYEKFNQSAMETLRMMIAATGTTSISVNRSILNVDPRINLESNCSIQMISNEMYETFVLPHDIELAKQFQPFGIHHCGDNMHNVAEGYSKVEQACFFDVGWGSDVASCREKIPDAFFNLRLSPVKIQTCTPEEVERDIVQLLQSAGELSRVGLCCINMDYGTPDENVAAIFQTAERYRRYGA